MSIDKESTLDEREGSRETTHALKALLARIGDIFGVFDFSFFVAGAVCFAAVLFAVHVFGDAGLRDAGWLSAAPQAEWKAAQICAAIVTCYVLGIVCFAAGALRRSFYRPYHALPKHLRDFGLEERYDGFLSPGGAPTYEHLYTRLWVEVRQSRDLAPSFNLLTRYWVMAAMCDGLGAAWAVWAVVWGVWMSTRPERPPGSILVLVEVAFVCAAALCWREAQRYSKYQMYELVATLSHVHVPVPVAPPAAVTAPVIARRR